MLRQPSEECLVLFAALCERAESLETFTTEQKRRLNLWRGQLSCGSQIKSYHNRQQVTNNYNRYVNIFYSVKTQRCINSFSRHQNNLHSHYQLTSTAPVHQKYAQKSSSYPNMQNNNHVSRHRHSIGCIRIKRQIGEGIAPINVVKTQNTARSASTNHVRFQDADVERKQKSVDIESNLESLCLQMMEHALGP